VKHFLIRISLFALLLWSSFWLMDAYLPYYWGNEGMASKIEYLEGKREKYNVFFMGSSRVYRQVIPTVFDAEMGDNTRSFNLGYRGVFNPESYYLLEHFIKKKAIKQTYILIELQLFTPIAERNLHTIRANYFLDYPYFSLVKKYYQYEKFPQNDSINQIIKHYNKSYWGNILKTEHVREMSLSILGQGDRDKHALGKSNDGFHSLEEAALYEKGLTKLHTNFLKKYNNIASFFNEEMTNYNIALTQNVAIHNTHLDKINQLIRIADRQNYTLIFMLPPKKSALLPLFVQIDAQHRINLAKPYGSTPIISMKKVVLYLQQH